MTESNEKVFEKLSSNVEILRLIFDLLDFENQLKFATLCQHLQYYFRNFICNDVYRIITVTKNQQFVIVRNRETSKDIELTPDGVEYFLAVYAEDVEELIERHGFALNCQKMRNLKSICYNHMMITNDQVEMLARHCPLLEKLQIYGCCNKERDIIRIGLDLRVQTLMDMQMLKCLILKTATEFRGKSSAIQDILTQLKLKYYNLKMVLIGPEDTDDKQAAGSSLEELDIYGPFSSSIRSCNLKTYLSCFENLISLTISIVDVTNGNEVITSLATSCRKLKKLAFKFTTFENIESFAVFTDLMEMSFHWCKGLTYENLKEILSEMQLEKFSSTYTKYQGLFQYYFVSPTLKSIHIDAFHSFEFRSA